jgi:sodium-dependent dicarboxylate transporter 2/3/5
MDNTSSTLRRQIGFIGGLLAFLAMIFLPSPEGLEPVAWHTAAVGVLMAVWWITEAIPIPATALVPLVAFPVLGINSIQEAAAPYANPLIYLFMGGFLIAVAMQRWDLHRRIALTIVRYVGVQPTSIVVGFIIASAFLSMWVSNTATALMMLPIGLSVIRLTQDAVAEADAPTPTHFSLVLVLCIAYACNIGGIGTLVGTPPNAFLAGFMLETYNVEIGFAQWMIVGLPLVFVSLPITYYLLTWIYPLEIKEIPGGRALINQQIERLGPMSDAERKVGLVFAGTALLWIVRPLLTDLIPGLSDAGVAMTAGLALFLIPTHTESNAHLLNWEEAEKLPWGVLILFGGGLSLADAISTTGLATWIGQGVSSYGTWPVLLIVLLSVATIVFLTEITSNTATSAAFLPILASAAIGIGQNPFLLVIPAALGASCAFMLPVATPPNAIVYGSGHISIPQMGRAGIWMNLVLILLITALAYTLLLAAFGVEVGVVPAWAQ